MLRKCTTKLRDIIKKWYLYVTSDGQNLIVEVTSIQFIVQTVIIIT